MRRIVHLSDLHFGRTSPALLEPLIQQTNRLKPDLCVISGDFTQRARHSQFREAAAFIKRIDAKVLTVPGNHDTPLDNLFVRMIRPWSRYRKYINQDLETTYQDDRMVVAGVNTANPWVHQAGRFSDEDLQRVCGIFADAGDRARVVVMHHPPEHLEGSDKTLMKGAAAALRGLAECGADVVLCGHIHRTHISPFTTAPGLLFVQAGTGLSNRLRNEENSFNVLDVSRPEIAVQAISAGADGKFAVTANVRFRRAPEGWLKLEEPLPT
ncbi:metallophosphoesterase [Falsirhodobacter sp. alg1]|uniref:metallophosphoesterase family protein n=1 Tax=Falsirhodobacter sp. alg1 TaxID=1472418 RepID=UPI0005EEB9C0|nr:metallophosphoesterase family protein [Falsirhodobacter sp. alg1]